MVVDPTSLVPLVVLAIQTAVAISHGFDAYKAHDETISGLYEEIEVFRTVLESLRTLAARDLQTSKLLEAPLKQYIRISQNFLQLLTKCNSRSNGEKTSVRDSILLQYHMDEITNYRRTLNEYKGTVNVAVAMITARKQEVSLEYLRENEETITIFMPRLEQRLQEIDQRLGEMAGSGSESPVSSAEDQLRMLDDRASTSECINICRQAQQEMHERIRLLSKADDGTTISGESSAEPIISKPVLQGWHDQLDTVASHLESSVPPMTTRMGGSSSQRRRRRLELEQERDSVCEQISVYHEFSRVAAEHGVVFYDVSAGPSAFQGIRSEVGHGLVADNVHVGRNGFQALGQFEKGAMSEAIQAHRAIRAVNMPAERDSSSSAEETSTLAQMTEQSSRNGRRDRNLVGRWQVQQRVIDTVCHFGRRERGSGKKAEATAGLKKAKKSKEVKD